MKSKKFRGAKVEKRGSFPRKAKDQSLVNLEHLAVIMKVINSSSDEDEPTKTDPIKCRRNKPKESMNKTNKHFKICGSKKNVILAGDRNSDCTSLRENENAENSHIFLEKKDLKPVSPGFLSNTSSLSHFMELGARTDLLCDSPMADPLGPDSFDNFQWVEVKQELPDEIEVSKVTLTEIPLRINSEKSTKSNCDDMEENNFVISDKGTNTDFVDPNHKPEAPFTNSENNSLPGDKEKSRNNSALEEREGEMLEILLSWDENSTDDKIFQESNETEISKKKKKKNYPQQCDICDKTLYSKGNLRFHKLKMHKLKVQFPCELCSCKFDYQREVVKHRNAVHRGEDGRFRCDTCGKRILDYHSYLSHMRTHMDGCEEVKGWDRLCSDCGKKFPDDESLRIHRTLVHSVDLRVRLKSQDKNFICDTCGRRFAFSCLLRDHINTHTGVKPYLCQKCGKAFCQKSTLKQHSRTHGDVRPFQCSECPQGFYSKSDFVKHRRKHTGERPYTCEVCKEGFSRNTHLVIHRRTHTGERPYVCDVCDRGFTKRGDVVRHRRVHTGELPYLCQVCGKAFRQSTQCANHIKSQHPDSPVSVARNPNPLVHGQLL